jgi:hypothetical protein
MYFLDESEAVRGMVYGRTLADTLPLDHLAPDRELNARLILRHGAVIDFLCAAASTNYRPVGRRRIACEHVTRHAPLAAGPAPIYPRRFAASLAALPTSGGRPPAIITWSSPVRRARAALSPLLMAAR